MRGGRKPKKRQDEARESPTLELGRRHGGGGGEGYGGVRGWLGLGGKKNDAGHHGAPRRLDQYRGDRGVVREMSNLSGGARNWRRAGGGRRHVCHDITGETRPYTG